MYVVYKQVGETPLQCIERLFDTKKNSYTYAGRLDPMAEGLLIVLKNEECKNAKQYYNLNKTYEYTFVIGIGTDTYDCLGSMVSAQYPEENMREKVRKAIGTLIGTQALPYPPYSSKTVNGKPLFEYARQNMLETITVPTKTIRIALHTMTAARTIEMQALAEEVIGKIKKVTGDFRQQEILRQWSTVENSEVQQYSATVTASAGTYVRALVHAIGEHIGYPTVTTSIKRVAIGEWEHPTHLNT